MNYQKYFFYLIICSVGSLHTMAQQSFGNGLVQSLLEITPHGITLHAKNPFIIATGVALIGTTFVAMSRKKTKQKQRVANVIAPDASRHTDPEHALLPDTEDLLTSPVNVVDLGEEAFLSGTLRPKDIVPTSAETTISPGASEEPSLSSLPDDDLRIMIQNVLEEIIASIDTTVSDAAPAAPMATALDTVIALPTPDFSEFIQVPDLLKPDLRSYFMQWAALARGHQRAKQSSHQLLLTTFKAWKQNAHDHAQAQKAVTAATMAPAESYTIPTTPPPSLRIPLISPQTPPPSPPPSPHTPRQSSSFLDEKAFSTPGRRRERLLSDATSSDRLSVSSTPGRKTRIMAAPDSKEEPLLHYLEWRARRIVSPRTGSGQVLTTSAIEKKN